MGRVRRTEPNWGDPWEAERDAEVVRLVQERASGSSLKPMATQITWAELDAYLRWGKRRELERSGLSAS